tara:strand:+ start:112 stop:285 length:174 start_codon:yes stop_codon:yes gene_type:complete
MSRNTQNSHFKILKTIEIKNTNDELESFKINKILFDSWVVRFQMAEKQKLKKRSVFS